MMRRRGAFWLLFAFISIPLSSCDQGAEGDLASCSSNFVGTFEGDLEGELLMMISSDGPFFGYFFASDGRTYTSEGDVTENGMLDTQGGVVFNGAIGFWTRARPASRAAVTR
jgi:hypothetical protein